jgi:hypothetical protein
MIKFNFVEDYVEYIAGLRDDLGQALNFFQRQQPRINLARYDVNIVDSLAYQTADNNVPYTDKQAELAVKIVVKYRKQLANLSKPVIVPEDNFIFRLGIRQVDRSKKIFLDKGNLIIKFPFDHKIIESIKSVNKTIMGSAAFDRDNRLWRYGLTEQTITFATSLSQIHNFEVSSEVLTLNEKILSIENGEPYRIELKLDDSKLTLQNAATDLLEYIEMNCGGLQLDNLLKLVDISSVLGYTIHSSVKDWLDQNVDQGISKYMLERKIEVAKSETVIDDILNYARLTNRTPIHMYDTGLPKKDSYDIVYLNNKKSNMPLNSLKLLVTFSPILMGGRKLTWLNNAEKVIIVK